MLRQLKKTKRVIGATLLSIAAILVTTSMVLAASYFANVQVTESDGNAYDQLPVMFSIGNSYLADNYYIRSDGLDTRVVFDSTELPWLVASDKLLFVSPISANSNTNLRYTLGNSVATYMPVIIGYTGYITIPDAAALELGNNFEIELLGYVNTDVGEGKSLVYKEDAFEIYVSDTEEITAELYGWLSPTSFVDPGVTWDDETKAYDENQATFAFESLGVASWGNFLELNIAAVPCGKVRFDADYIAGYTQNIDLDVFYEADWHHVYQGTFADHVWVEKEIPAGIKTVTAARVRFQNVHATFASTATLYEFDFSYIPTVIATGISSDDMEVKVTADGTNLKIFIDNVEEDSVALLGVSALDSLGDWLIMGNDTTDFLYYMDYYKHTVSGTLIAHYQPITIIANTAVAGTADDGTTPVEGTADNGTTETLVDNALTQVEDFWNLARLTIVTTTDSLAPEGEVAIVTDFTAADDTLHFEALTAAVEAGDTYAVVLGTLETLVDDALTQADDYWNLARFTIITTTDGLAPEGESAVITDFVEADDTLHFAALTAYIEAGDTYKVEFGTLPDREGAAQDGRITWGTNPTGVTSTMGSFISYSQPEPQVYGGEDTIPDIIPPIGDDWGGEGDLTGNPVYPLVSALSDLSGFAERQVWIFGAGAFIILGMLITYRFIPHLLIASAVGTALIGLFVAFEILPFWTLFIAIIGNVSILIWERTPSV